MWKGKLVRIKIHWNLFEGSNSRSGPHPSIIFDVESQTWNGHAASEVSGCLQWTCLIQISDSSSSGERYGNLQWDPFTNGAFQRFLFLSFGGVIYLCRILHGSIENTKPHRRHTLFLSWHWIGRGNPHAYRDSIQTMNLGSFAAIEPRAPVLPSHCAS